MLNQFENTKELDLLFSNWRREFKDKLLYDQAEPTKQGDKHRTMCWELGKFRFHGTYTETRPNISTWKLTSQDIDEKEKWGEFHDLEAFRKALFQARQSRDERTNDVKAAKGNGLNMSDVAPDNIIMATLSGSHLYGLNHNGLFFPDGTEVKPSDEDIRGVFVIPTSKLIVNEYQPKGKKLNDFVQLMGRDEKYEEMGRFVYECMKCNPERLELLSAPSYHITSEWWERLVAIRKAFYSRKRMFDALGGYSTQQFMKWRKSEGDLWKPGMHLLRLMHMGIRLFETGEFTPDMSMNREFFLEVRTGRVKAEVVEKEFEQLRARFNELFETSTAIPLETDSDKIIEFMHDFRKAHW
jgi:predicted nucleotidyltransferase